MQNNNIIQTGTDLHQQRLLKLYEKRKYILTLQAEKAIDAILDEKHPAALIHSFPEEEFYYLIHHIGIEDSLDLLSLASFKQWEYILDIDTWEKDKVHIPILLKWFDFLLMADSKRLIEWLYKEKIELLEYFLYKNIDVVIREHDQDPSEIGEDYTTFDDVYYFKIIEYNTQNILPDENSQEDIINKLLKHIISEDIVSYQNLLHEFQTIICAESEEEMYRLRNVRLAEKGFIPYEDSFRIYQPVSDIEIKNMQKKYLIKDMNALFSPLIYPIQLSQDNNLFVKTLKKIEDDSIRFQLQAEFANLCNMIISADKIKIRSRKELEFVVKKASGYLSTGIESFMALNRDNKKHDSCRLIQNYPLETIFRMGFGNAVKLKWKVQKWIKNSWFSLEKLPLSFWDEIFMGVLGGLLIKKPLFFDNYKTGTIYREFKSSADILETQKTVDEIILFDTLLSLMNIDTKNISEKFLTYKNLLLTLWTRDFLNLSKEVKPVPKDSFKKFFTQLWINNNSAKKIDPAMKTSFLYWIIKETGLKEHEITTAFSQAFESLFSEIESEYKDISTQHIKSRYFQLFLIEDTDEIKSFTI